MAINDPNDLDVISWFLAHEEGTHYTLDGSNKLDRLICQTGDAGMDLVRYLGAGRSEVSGLLLNAKSGITSDTPGEAVGFAPAATPDLWSTSTELNVFALIKQTDPFVNHPGLYMHSVFASHIRPFSWNFNSKIRTETGDGWPTIIGPRIDDGDVVLLHVQQTASETRLGYWPFQATTKADEDVATGITFPLSGYGPALFGSNHIGDLSWGGTVYGTVAARAMTAQEIDDTRDWFWAEFAETTAAPVDPANKITAVAGITDEKSLFAQTPPLVGVEVFSWTSPSGNTSIADVTIDSDGYPIFGNADAYGPTEFTYNWETSDGAGDWNAAGIYKAVLEQKTPVTAPTYAERNSIENTSVSVDLSGGWENVDPGNDGEFSATGLPGTTTMDIHGLVTGDVGAVGTSNVVVTYTPAVSTPTRPPVSAASFPWEVIVRPPAGTVSGAARLGIKNSISIS